MQLFFSVSDFRLLWNIIWYLIKKSWWCECIPLKPYIIHLIKVASYKRHSLWNHTQIDCLFNIFLILTSKLTLKLPITCLLWGKSTCHRWIPLTKGQWRDKRFNVIRSWYIHYIPYILYPTKCAGCVCVIVHCCRLLSVCFTHYSPVLIHWHCGDQIIFSVPVSELWTIYVNVSLNHHGC